MTRWLLVLFMYASTVMAAPTQGVLERAAQAVLQSANSLNAQMLMMIARGDVAGAVSLWQLEMGREAPRWLQAFQAAFSTANQRAGPCAQVARDVFEGFKRLGANPSYVQFTTKVTRETEDYIAFDLRAADPRSAIQISNNALHLAVQVGDRIYDAMTGPMGLKVAEYTGRLHSPALVISMQTVSQLP